MNGLRDNLFASSILLHEMAHFLQQESGRYDKKYTCEKAMELEREAYGAQGEYLTRYGVYRLVYVESYARAEEAIAREKQLKRWKRDWKIELIERENLEWRDLSDLIV